MKELPFSVFVFPLFLALFSHHIHASFLLPKNHQNDSKDKIDRDPQEQGQHLSVSPALLTGSSFDPAADPHFLPPTLDDSKEYGLFARFNQIVNTIPWQKIYFDDIPSQSLLLRSYLLSVLPLEQLRSFASYAYVTSKSDTDKQTMLSRLQNDLKESLLHVYETLDGKSTEKIKQLMRVFVYEIVSKSIAGLKKQLIEQGIDDLTLAIINYSKALICNSTRVADFQGTLFLEFKDGVSFQSIYQKVFHLKQFEFFLTRKPVIEAMNIELADQGDVAIWYLMNLFTGLAYSLDLIESQSLIELSTKMHEIKCPACVNDITLYRELFNTSKRDISYNHKDKESKESTRFSVTTEVTAVLKTSLLQSWNNLHVLKQLAIEFYHRLSSYHKQGKEQKIVKQGGSLTRGLEFLSFINSDADTIALHQSLQNLIADLSTMHSTLFIQYMYKQLLKEAYSSSVLDFFDEILRISFLIHKRPSFNFAGVFGQSRILVNLNTERDQTLQAFSYRWLTVYSDKKGLITLQLNDIRRVLMEFECFYAATSFNACYNQDKNSKEAKDRKLSVDQSMDNQCSWYGSIVTFLSDSEIDQMLLQGIRISLIKRISSQESTTDNQLLNEIFSNVKLDIEKCSIMSIKSLLDYDLHFEKVQIKDTGINPLAFLYSEPSITTNKRKELVDSSALQSSTSLTSSPETKKKLKYVGTIDPQVQVVAQLDKIDHVDYSFYGSLAKTLLSIDPNSQSADQEFLKFGDLKKYKDKVSTQDPYVAYVMCKLIQLFPNNFARHLHHLKPLHNLQANTYKPVTSNQTATSTSKRNSSNVMIRKRDLIELFTKNLRTKQDFERVAGKLYALSTGYYEILSLDTSLPFLTLQFTDNLSTVPFTQSLSSTMKSLSPTQSDQGESYFISSMKHSFIYVNEQSHRLEVENVFKLISTMSTLSSFDKVSNFCFQTGHFSILLMPKCELDFVRQLLSNQIELLKQKYEELTRTIELGFNCLVLPNFGDVLKAEFLTHNEKIKDFTYPRRRLDVMLMEMTNYLTDAHAQKRLHEVITDFMGQESKGGKFLTAILTNFYKKDDEKEPLENLGEPFYSTSSSSSSSCSSTGETSSIISLFKPSNVFLLKRWGSDVLPPIIDLKSCSTSPVLINYFVDYFNLIYKAGHLIPVALNLKPFEQLKSNTKLLTTDHLKQLIEVQGAHVMRHFGMVLQIAETDPDAKFLKKSPFNIHAIKVLTNSLGYQRKKQLASMICSRYFLSKLLPSKSILISAIVLPSELEIERLNSSMALGHAYARAIYGFNIVFNDLQQNSTSDSKEEKKQICSRDFIAVLDNWVHVVLPQFVKVMRSCPGVEVDLPKLCIKIVSESPVSELESFKNHIQLRHETIRHIRLKVDCICMVPQEWKANESFVSAVNSIQKFIQSSPSQRPIEHLTMASTKLDQLANILGSKLSRIMSDWQKIIQQADDQDKLLTTHSIEIVSQSNCIQKMVDAYYKMVQRVIQIYKQISREYYSRFQSSSVSHPVLKDNDESSEDSDGAFDTKDQRAQLMNDLNELQMQMQSIAAQSSMYSLSILTTALKLTSQYYQKDKKNR